MKNTIFFTISLFFFTGCMTFSSVDKTVFSFDEKQAEIISKKKMDFPGIREASGIVFNHGEFFIINDSYNKPSVFRFNRQKWTAEEIVLTGCRNRDWEDLAVGGNGIIHIGDTGNNLKKRRNPVIYSINISDKESVNSAVTRKISLKRADKNAAFDAEAIFCSGNSIYLITKERKKRDAEVFRALLPIGNGEESIMKKIGVIRTEYPVTAADTRGNELIILTYGSIIKAAVSGDEIYIDSIYRLDRKRAGKCEGICYAGKHIFAVNEEGYFMEIVLRARKECYGK